MKKIMFAAIAAAMTGAAVAECSTCCNSCDTDCVYAYEFVLLAKTTTGRSAYQAATCECESATVCGCYRAPAMKKIAGFLWGKAVNADYDPEEECSSQCVCQDFSYGTGYEFQNQAFWDVGTGRVVPVQASDEEDGYGAGLRLWQIDGINKDYNRDVIEAFGTFSFFNPIQITDAEQSEYIGYVGVAGFGHRGKRGNGQIMIKDLVGFFAGYFPVCCWDSTTSQCTTTTSASDAAYWTLCQDTVGDNETWLARTAAYGKWKLVWNSTAVARLTANYSVGAITKSGYAAQSSLTAILAEEDGEEAGE